MHWQLADVNDPFYYWHNFDVVRRWVETHHFDLLSDEQRQILADYECLPRNAQCLWLRFFMRKGELFRVDRLTYPEIKIGAALEALTRQRWLKPIEEPSEESLSLFTVNELRQFYAPSNQSKLDKKSLVKKLSNEASGLPGNSGDVVQLLRNDGFNELSLLFFGNSHQQISEFVVAALGHVNYESYRIRPRSVFPDAPTFRYFCQIESLEQHYRTLDSLEQKLSFAKQILNDAQLQNVPPQLRGKVSRFINKVARDCERAQAFDLALTLYQLSHRPPSRERQARIMHKTDPNKCRSTLLEMCANPRDELERDVASRLLQRWFKHSAFAEPAESPCITVDLVFSPRQVEKAALKHYLDQGWQGLHAENVIVQALFGLTFWDIIFADIEGAFIHPFQRGPRDLNSPSFYLRRKQRIRRRLASLVSRPNAVKSRIERYLVSKHGLANPFVPWKWQRLADILDWFDRIPVAIWHDIFRRIAFDVKNNRSGFPDLWLYKADEVVLVEVKGPGDAIRPNQRQWLRRLADSGLKVQVLNVN